MNAFADAWGHANNVRMWLGQAATDLAASGTKTAGGLFGRWLTKGRSSKSAIDEAAESLSKARLAWQDLAFWLGRAGQSCPPKPLTLADGFLQSRPDTILTMGADVKYEINDKLVDLKRQALARDIAALDGLIGWLDQKQRAQA